MRDDGPLVSWAMEEGGLRCTAHRQGPAVSPDAVVVLQDMLGGRLAAALDEHAPPGGVRGRPPGGAGVRAPRRAPAALGRHPRPRLTELVTPGVRRSERSPLLGGLVPAEPLAPLGLPHDVGAAGGVPLWVVARRRGLPGARRASTWRRAAAAGRASPVGGGCGRRGRAGGSGGRARVGDGCGLPGRARAGGALRARVDGASSAGRCGICGRRAARPVRRRRGGRPDGRPSTVRRPGDGVGDRTGCTGRGHPAGDRTGWRQERPWAGWAGGPRAAPPACSAPARPGAGSHPRAGRPTAPAAGPGRPRWAGRTRPAAPPTGRPGSPDGPYGAGGRGRRGPARSTGPLWALPTTNVLAAMSPTRRCPFVVRPVMNPTSGKHHGAASTIHSSVRTSPRPNPGLPPCSSTTFTPNTALPGVSPVAPCSAAYRPKNATQTTTCTGDVAAGGEVDAIADLDAARTRRRRRRARRRTRRRRCRAPRSTRPAG